MKRSCDKETEAEADAAERLTRLHKLVKRDAETRRRGRGGEKRRDGIGVARLQRAVRRYYEEVVVP